METKNFMHPSTAVQENGHLDNKMENGIIHTKQEIATNMTLMNHSTIKTETRNFKTHSMAAKGNGHQVSKRKRCCIHTKAEKGSTSPWRPT